MPQRRDSTGPAKIAAASSSEHVGVEVRGEVREHERPAPALVACSPACAALRWNGKQRAVAF